MFRRTFYSALAFVCVWSLAVAGEGKITIEIDMNEAPKGSTPVTLKPVQGGSFRGTPLWTGEWLGFQEFNKKNLTVDYQKEWHAQNRNSLKEQPLPYQMWCDDETSYSFSDGSGSCNGRHFSYLNMIAQFDAKANKIYVTGLTIGCLGKKEGVTARSREGEFSFTMKILTYVPVSGYNGYDPRTPASHDIACRLKLDHLFDKKFTLRDDRSIKAIIENVTFGQGSTDALFYILPPPPPPPLPKPERDKKLIEAGGIVDDLPSDVNERRILYRIANQFMNLPMVDKLARLLNWDTVYKNLPKEYPELFKMIEDGHFEPFWMYNGRQIADYAQRYYAQLKTHFITENQLEKITDDQDQPLEVRNKLYWLILSPTERIKVVFKGGETERILGRDYLAKKIQEQNLQTIAVPRKFIVPPKPPEKITIRFTNKHKKEICGGGKQFNIQLLEAELYAEFIPTTPRIESDAALFKPIHDHAVGSVDTYGKNNIIISDMDGTRKAYVVDTEPTDWFIFFNLYYKSDVIQKSNKHWELLAHLSEIRSLNWGKDDVTMDVTITDG